MRYLILLPLILVAACGGGDPVNQFVSGGTLTGPILYPNDGRSNALFTCNDSAVSVQTSIELGMSKSQVRSILGKPRHISPDGEDWRYGTDSSNGKGPKPDEFLTNFYTMPVANFQYFTTFANTDSTEEVDDDAAELDLDNENITSTDRAFLDDFSGDDSECTDSDVPFIEAANSYALDAGNVDFSSDVPNCFDAAVRIAAAVEQGMSLSQVRGLVGKPVEVAIDGTHWRYNFGSIVSPYVFFTKYDLTGAYYVTGYSSVTLAC